MRQPTMSACPLLSICWEKLKQIKLKFLCTCMYFSWMCCVVTEFVYANTIILFNLGEKWILECSPPCFTCCWIFCQVLFTSIVWKDFCPGLSQDEQVASCACTELWVNQQKSHLFTLASFFTLTLSESFSLCTFFYMYSQIHLCKSFRFFCVDIGIYVMVWKCFVRNDKVDAVEQCYDEWQQIQFIFIETQQYSVCMLTTCCNRQ